jgi:hypothetical protein
MPHYRTYFLARDSSISSALDLDCESDVHAIDMVAGLGAADVFELWQGMPRVGRIEPTAA